MWLMLVGMNLIKNNTNDNGPNIPIKMECTKCRYVISIS